jgi:hypothetical protein
MTLELMNYLLLTYFSKKFAIESVAIIIISHAYILIAFYFIKYIEIFQLQMQS